MQPHWKELSGKESIKEMRSQGASNVPGVSNKIQGLYPCILEALDAPCNVLDSLQQRAAEAPIALRVLSSKKRHLQIPGSATNGCGTHRLGVYQQLR